MRYPRALLGLLGTHTLTHNMGNNTLQELDSLESEIVLFGWTLGTLILVDSWSEELPYSGVILRALYRNTLKPCSCYYIQCYLDSMVLLDSLMHSCKAVGHPKCHNSRGGPAWGEVLGSKRNPNKKPIKEKTPSDQPKLQFHSFEVSLGPVKPLHPVQDLQVGLRLMKMDPNDFSWHSLTPKTNTYHVSCSKTKLSISIQESRKSSSAFYSPTIMFLPFMLIWGSWKRSYIISDV